MKIFQAFEKFQEIQRKKAEEKECFLPLPKKALWKGDHTNYLVFSKIKKIPKTFPFSFRKRTQIFYSLTVYREEDFVKLFQFTAKNLSELIKNLRIFCKFYQIPEKKVDILFETL